MSRTNKYGTPQPGELTAKQWAEKGYKPNESAQGIDRWFGVGTHRCYTESEVTFVGVDAIKAEQQARRRESDRVRREQRKEREADEARLIELSESYHTAHQWLTEYGRIPLPGAKWIEGNKRAGQSENYYYCHLSDTREPQSETELQDIIDREHNAYTETDSYYNGKMITQ